jgi:chromosome segregation ATPase
MVRVSTLRSEIPAAIVMSTNWLKVKTLNMFTAKRELRTMTGNLQEELEERGVTTEEMEEMMSSPEDRTTLLEMQLMDLEEEILSAQTRVELEEEHLENLLAQKEDLEDLLVVNMARTERTSE